jgi:hypothetical protein
VGEITTQIEKDIGLEREALGRNLDELEARARVLADWRTHYRNHAAAALGLSFGAGIVLGLLAVPSRDRRRQGRYWPGDADASLSDVDAPLSDLDASVEFASDVDAGSAAPPRRPGSLRRGIAAIGASEGAGRVRHQAEDTVQRIVEALVAVASAKLVDFVSGVVPGFSEHFDGPDAPRRARS